MDIVKCCESTISGNDPHRVFNPQRLRMGFKLRCDLISVLEFNTRLDQCREMGNSGPVLFLSHAIP